jgi:AAA15 family ATPase/GTPase
VIPIKLKLRNFMSYHEGELAFRGIHLAALTGENGAGKSSLLDAITWALGLGKALCLTLLPGLYGVKLGPGEMMN